MQRPGEFLAGTNAELYPVATTGPISGRRHRFSAQSHEHSSTRVIRASYVAWFEDSRHSNP